MKYSSKFIIFQLSRKNKNYIYISENLGQFRKQIFENTINPFAKGTILYADTSIFNKINFFMNKDSFFYE